MKVDVSQIPSLTNNGVIRTSGSTGNIYVDTSSYTTGVTTDNITLTGNGSTVPLGVSVNSVPRMVQIKITSDSALLTTGSGKFKLVTPLDLSGFTITSSHCAVTTTGTTTDTIVLIQRIRGASSVSVLSTNMYINTGKTTSYESSPQPVVNVSNNSVITGDIISVDVNNAATNSKGLTVMLTFQKP